ncbi:Os03g0128050 [Oryza sativa Japonica Group]|uniref:Os03g0128050 protein n=1 Tax=Oryza sativa subsp. japonica TaxID=39947 RepID=A0A0P0VSJ4_ORYSJ|nr:Os03g0128050 [Oryza sativa Japonica Group]
MPASDWSASRTSVDIGPSPRTSSVIDSLALISSHTFVSDSIAVMFSPRAAGNARQATKTTTAATSRCAAAAISGRQLLLPPQLLDYTDTHRRGGLAS